MAILDASRTTASFSGSGPLNVAPTKPTGLAAGDMLVALLPYRVESSDPDNGAFDTPSGWTSIVNNTSGDTRTQAFRKVADSSDAAASDFTFTRGGGSDNVVGYAILYRITGHGNVVTSAIASASTTNAPSFANTITPATADSLLIFLVNVVGNLGASGSIGSYAIATDDPGSWSEGYDQFTNEATGVGQDHLVASATAVRSAVTATGNSSVTVTPASGTAATCVGLMICILAQRDSTFNTDPLVVTSTIPNAVVTGDANFTPDPLVLNATLPTETHTQASPRVTNKDKNTASTIVNKDKN